MKTILILGCFLLGANVFAADTKPQNIGARCDLADLSNQSNPNILNQVFNVAWGKPLQVTTYNGHVYEIAVFDESNAANPDRYELSLDARDANTKTVIGSASVIFSNQIPELTYQDGENILLDCMPQ